MLLWLQRDRSCGTSSAPRPLQPSLAGPLCLSSCAARGSRLPFPSSLLLRGFSTYTSECTDSLVVLSPYGDAAQPGDLFLAFSLGGTSLHYE